MPDAPAIEHYRSAAGSTVKVTGQHRGIIEIEFDWFEEGACIEARRSVSADTRDPTDAVLTWWCDCHGERQAPLTREMADA